MLALHKKGTHLWKPLQVFSGQKVKPGLRFAAHNTTTSWEVLRWLRCSIHYKSAFLADFIYLHYNCCHTRQNTADFPEYLPRVLRIQCFVWWSTELSATLERTAQQIQKTTTQEEPDDSTVLNTACTLLLFVWLLNHPFKFNAMKLCWCSKWTFFLFCFKKWITSVVFFSFFTI